MFFQRCRRILLKLLVIWDLIGGVKIACKAQFNKNYYATVNTNIDEATRKKNEVDVDIELNIPQKSFFESFESYEPKLHAAINASFDEYKRKQKSW